MDAPANGRRRLRRTLVAALAGIAAVATVATIAALSLGLPGGEPNTGASLEGNTAESPSRTPSESPNPVRCWDGTIAEQTHDCATPTGREGLLWVYPSFQSDRTLCRRILRPRAAEKVLGYFCPFTARNPEEGIRYSEWTSAAAARETISRDFNPWPEQDVERHGYIWSLWLRESRDEAGRFSSALAYRDWPFSAEAVSNTARAAKLTCNFVEQRAPTTFKPVQSLCLPRH